VRDKFGSARRVRVSETSGRKIHCSGSVSAPVVKTDTEGTRCRSRNNPKIDLLSGCNGSRTRATPISLRSSEAGRAEVRVADSPGVEVTGTLTDHEPGAFNTQSRFGVSDSEYRYHPPIRQQYRPVRHIECSCRPLSTDSELVRKPGSTTYDAAVCGGRYAGVSREA
jgi:hypothetical protein